MVPMPFLGHVISILKDYDLFDHVTSANMEGGGFLLQQINVSRTSQNLQFHTI